MKYGRVRITKQLLHSLLAFPSGVIINQLEFSPEDEQYTLHICADSDSEFPDAKPEKGITDLCPEWETVDGVTRFMRWL